MRTGTSSSTHIPNTVLIAAKIASNVIPKSISSIGTSPKSSAMLVAMNPNTLATADLIAKNIFLPLSFITLTVCLIISVSQKNSTVRAIRESPLQNTTVGTEINKLLPEFLFRSVHKDDIYRADIDPCYRDIVPELLYYLIFKLAVRI